jgi:hypothetical protein
MKSNIRIILLVAASIVMSLGVINQAFNPFSASDWEDVGDTIKGGFEDLGSSLKNAFEKGVEFGGKVYHSAKDLVEEVFKKIEACTKVVPLGAEWAAKKAAYEAAQATLQAADTLKVLDPRVLSFQVAEETANASLEAAKQALEGARQTAQGVSKVLESIATAAGKGFNVKEISFETYMSKLIEGKGPKVTFVADILGQSVTLKDFEINFNKPVEAAKDIVKMVAEKIAQPFK